MPKKAGILCIILGAVLILSALLLFLYNTYDGMRAGQDAELALSDVQSAIAANQATQMTEPVQTQPDETTPTEETEPEETQDPEMPVTYIGGNGYIGYLAIPDLELELPVMDTWSESKLNVAPCRQFGSTRTDDLVIAAHNFATHFGKLSTLEDGADVFFTDMDGIEIHYRLTKMETLSPYSIEEVQYSGHDLVLYTCTPGGASRVVAFCDRVEESE